MKTILFILTIFLSINISAQNTTVPIDGFGNFKFGMTKKEVQNAIKNHKTKQTKVQNLKTHISIENIELDGTIYDDCTLSVDEKLSLGTFMNFFSTRQGAEMQFNQLFQSLSKKYGENSVDNWSATWYDSKNRIIMLKIEEKNDKITLLLAYLGSLSF